MSSKQQPQLGSVALQNPTPTPQIINVTPSTCDNLSLFKEILREYRRLDDTIIIRLNRANATMRDNERTHENTSKLSVQDQACAYVWRELMENWKRRAQIVRYCTDVADRSLEEKRQALQEQSNDPTRQRKIQAAIFEGQVKRNQVHNELSVENIVRKRAVDGFRSRCQYFTPPKTDEESRRMWDSAQ